MHFSKALGIFSFATLASAAHISYDRGYDDANRTMEFVACSDGPNGLITRYGWSVQGDIRNFPYIGGAQAVDDWDSPNCGSCWQATYNGRSIFVLAIDHTDSGLNIAFDALDDLTNGNAKKFGVIDATVSQVPLKMCRL
ncbi:Cerato-platanin [Podospora appendiculata]|uniref:Cerato-platanin n=1 Tax=Podospora appendiculata TaxID=314037 RepID=A0AAE0X548_9PEZI|nr:Cerato-platanin [Podospora appendiculata]